MTKLISVLLLALAPLHSSLACSVFESPFANDSRFAHNVDWYPRFPDVKGTLTVNPPHLKKTGMTPGAPNTPAQWNSKYGSVTFSIAGAEFPVDGFNEKGLFMAVLELPETVYAPATDPRGALNVAQFVQYNLDRSATIEDVIASDKEVRPISSLVKMHWFVCDASAKCAVLQVRDGVMQVYRGADLPYNVMTNSPYPVSMKAASSCIADEKSCAMDQSSLGRFSSVALLRTKMDVAKPFAEQAIGILDAVAQSNAGGVTRFQVILDPANATIQLRKRGTAEMGVLKVDWSKLDCHQPRRVIEVNETATGDLSSKWFDLTEAYQIDQVTKMGYPPAMATVYGKLPFTFTCE